MKSFLYSSLLSLSLLACGGTDPTTTSASASPSEPAACNALANVAEIITVDAVAAEPPLPTGGKVEDGMYVATKAVVYTGAAGRSGPTSQTLRLTTRITGTAAESILDGVARSSTLTTSGTTLTTTSTCPEQSVVQYGYSATATSLVVFIPSGAGKTLVHTFTRQ